MDSEEIDKWDEESERAWREDNHNVDFTPSVVSVLKEILPQNARVLDAGCGIGKHVKAFTKLGYEVVGLDQSKRGIYYARILNPDVTLFNIRLLDLDTYNYYDLIHTCAVLQHSTHERKRGILHKFYHALKKGGYLLCAECTFTPENTKNFSEEWSDGYSFSEKGWIKFMAENGFKHVKTILPWPYYVFQVNK